jgi:hypothetical protein
VEAEAGIWTFSPPDPWVKLSGTKCWSMSAWWVSAPSETRLTAVIDAASGVATFTVAPYVAAAGADATVGRAPLNR